MAQLEIKNENLILGFDTLGAELQYIRDYEGNDYLWNGDPKVWKYRAPVLFPFCGDLNGGKYLYNGKEYFLPRHGFARDMEFEVLLSEQRVIEFCLTDSIETRKMYPFSFCLKVRYELSGWDIKVSYTVENTGDADMYFSIGSHEGYYLKGGIESYSVYTDEIIPLKYYYFEGDEDTLTDEYPEYSLATLKSYGNDRFMEVEFGEVSSFSIWTKPGAEFICLEPWHGIPESEDADPDITKKAGIIKLNPKEIKEFVHTIRLNVQVEQYK